MILRLATSGTRFLASSRRFIDGRPSTAFSFLLASPTRFIAILDVFRLTLLFFAIR